MISVDIRKSREFWEGCSVFWKWDSIGEGMCIVGDLVLIILLSGVC